MSVKNKDVRNFDSFARGHHGVRSNRNGLGEGYARNSDAHANQRGIHLRLGPESSPSPDAFCDDRYGNWRKNDNGKAISSGRTCVPDSVPSDLRGWPKETRFQAKEPLNRVHSNDPKSGSYFEKFRSESSSDSDQPPVGEFARSFYLGNSFKKGDNGSTQATTKEPNHGIILDNWRTKAQNTETSGDHPSGIKQESANHMETTKLGENLKYGLKSKNDFPRNKFETEIMNPIYETSTNAKCSADFSQAEHGQQMNQDKVSLLISKGKMLTSKASAPPLIKCPNINTRKKVYKINEANALNESLVACGDSVSQEEILTSIQSLQAASKIMESLTPLRHMAPRSPTFSAPCTFSRILSDDFDPVVDLEVNKASVLKTKSNSKSKGNVPKSMTATNLYDKHRNENARIGNKGKISFYASDLLKDLQQGENSTMSSVATHPSQRPSTCASAVGTNAALDNAEEAEVSSAHKIVSTEKEMEDHTKDGSEVSPLNTNRAAGNNRHEQCVETIHETVETKDAFELLQRKVRILNDSLSFPLEDKEWNPTARISSQVTIPKGRWEASKKESPKELQKPEMGATFFVDLTKGLDDSISEANQASMFHSVNMEDDSDNLQKNENRPGILDQTCDQRENDQTTVREFDPKNTNSHEIDVGHEESGNGVDTVVWKPGSNDMKSNMATCSESSAGVARKGEAGEGMTHDDDDDDTWAWSELANHKVRAIPRWQRTEAGWEMDVRVDVSSLLQELKEEKKKTEIKLKEAEDMVKILKNEKANEVQKEVEREQTSEITKKEDGGLECSMELDQTVKDEEIHPQEGNGFPGENQNMYATAYVSPVFEEDETQKHEPLVEEWEGILKEKIECWKEEKKALLKKISKLEQEKKLLKDELSNRDKEWKKEVKKLLDEVNKEKSEKNEEIRELQRKLSLKEEGESFVFQKEVWRRPQHMDDTRVKRNDRHIDKYEILANGSDLGDEKIQRRVKDLEVNIEKLKAQVVQFKRERDDAVGQLEYISQNFTAAYCFRTSYENQNKEGVQNSLGKASDSMERGKHLPHMMGMEEVASQLSVLQKLLEEDRRIYQERLMSAISDCESAKWALQSAENKLAEETAKYHSLEKRAQEEEQEKVRELEEKEVQSKKALEDAISLVQVERQKEIERAQKQYENAIDEVKKLQDQVDLLQTEEAKLRDALDGMTKRLVERDALLNQAQQVVDAARKELDLNKSLIEDLKASLYEEERRKRDAQEESAEVKRLLQDLKEAMKDEEEKMGGLKMRLKEREYEKLVTEKAMEKAKEEMEELRQQAKFREAECNSIMERVIRAEAEIEARDRVIQSVKCEVDSLLQTRDSLALGIDSLRKSMEETEMRESKRFWELNEKENTIIQVQERVRILQDEAMDLKRELEDATKAKAELEKELDERKRERIVFLREVEELQKKNLDLEEEVLLLEGQICILKNPMDKVSFI